MTGGIKKQSWILVSLDLQYIPIFIQPGQFWFRFSKSSCSRHIVIRWQHPLKYERKSALLSVILSQILPSLQHLIFTKPELPAVQSIGLDCNLYAIQPSLQYACAPAFCQKLSANLTPIPLIWITHKMDRYLQPNTNRQRTKQHYSILEKDWLTKHP